MASSYTQAQRSPSSLEFTLPFILSTSWWSYVVRCSGHLLAIDDAVNVMNWSILRAGTAHSRVSLYIYGFRWSSLSLSLSLSLFFFKMLFIIFFEWCYVLFVGSRITDFINKTMNDRQCPCFPSSWIVVCKSRRKEWLIKEFDEFLISKH